MSLSVLEVLLVIVGGGFAGQTINYLADVLPRNRSLTGPVCAHCGTTIGWPRFLRFERCPNCNRNRSVRSYLILIGTPSFFIYLWMLPNIRLPDWLACLVSAYLFLIAVIDIEQRLVLHPTSLAGVVLCALAGIWNHGVWPTVLGGLAGFGIMLSLYYLGIIFNRWMAKIREQEIDEVALGFGDVNLAGILGLLLGWPGITAGLLFAIFLGGIVSLMIIIGAKITRQYKMFTAIPYAPFLILGAILLLFRP